MHIRRIAYTITKAIPLVGGESKVSRTRIVVEVMVDSTEKDEVNQI